MEQTQKMSLRQKLFEIQKSQKTFAQTEEAEKKANGNPKKSAYNYTPGWKIVESIRNCMDNLGVMLDSTTVEDKHQMISYYVYKEKDGTIVPFEKKEMYVTVKREYTWVDVNTGETVGPFTQTAAGANGTDKSIASAESLCERYFLLKFFHITTRELCDEPDAHDSSTVPGNVNYPDAKDFAYGNGLQPLQSQIQPNTQTVQQQFYIPIQNQQPQANLTPEQTYGMAVNELSNFGKGTQSHAMILNKWMSALNIKGYNTADPSFAANLIETAQARREGRAPAFV